MKQNETSEKIDKTLNSLLNTKKGTWNSTHENTAIFTKIRKIKENVRNEETDLKVR